MFCVLVPVEQLLLIRVRSAWHTESLTSGRSLMAMPSVRAKPLKDSSRSTGHVQKPESIVQIYNRQKVKLLGYFYF